MHIESSKEFKELAIHWRIEEKHLSKLIIHLATKNGIIEDIPECYGITIGEHIDGIGENVGEMFNKLFPFAPETKLELFSELRVMGDGGCPHCGGDGEYHDGESRCVGGDGYETPYEYSSIWEEHKCLNCGEIFNVQ